MIAFIFRRLVGMAVVLLVVFGISFALVNAVPGGPFQGERALSAETIAALEKQHGLDRPLLEQAWNRITGYLTGDFGESIKLGVDVKDVILQGLPVSAALGAMALVFAFTLGLTAGILSAVRRGTGTDFWLMSTAAVGIALPNFVVAGFAILIFVFAIPLFPAGGWGTLRQLVLPAMCLGAPYAAYVARIARTGMLDVLSQDHVRTARAKGLSYRSVVLKHAMPTAMLPVVSFLGPAVAGVLTGSPVVESIFAIPGLGWHFVQSAFNRDYFMAMGLVMVYTTLLYSMNLLVDLSYAVLDPRVDLRET
ncbi:MAG: ABC transporter permease [Planctomycetota bacterium]